MRHLLRISTIGKPSTGGGGAGQVVPEGVKVLDASGSGSDAGLTAGVVALVWQKALVLGQTVTPEQIRSRSRSGASNIGSAPFNSPTSSYTFDGVREGVLSAPGALAP